jgi:hypothetical protein
MAILVVSCKDLLRLSRNAHALSAVHDPLRLRLPTLTAQTNQRWQDRLEAYRTDCGCGFGAICGILAAIVGIAAWFPFRSLTFATVLSAVLRAGGATLMFALAGKLLGLKVAAWRFRRACTRLCLVVMSSTNHSST